MWTKQSNKFGAASVGFRNKFTGDRQYKKIGQH